MRSLELLDVKIEENKCNPSERITYPWERIDYYVFFLNLNVPSGLSYLVLFGMRTGKRIECVLRQLQRPEKKFRTFQTLEKLHLYW